MREEPTGDSQNLTPPDLLRKAGCFPCLDETSRERVMREMVPVDFAPGDVICREGAQGDCMYVIESGEVSITKGGADGASVEIAVLGPNETVGEMSLFDHSPRSGTVSARKASRLWKLGAPEFDRLLAENPALAKALLACLSERLRRENTTVATLRSAEFDRRLKIAFFDSKPYTEKAFRQVNAERYALKFFQPRLSADTVLLAKGFKAVCVFVNDSLSTQVVQSLRDMGIALIALRCAGYNNVDLASCRKYGIEVVRVPAYSPYAVAEHAVAMMLTLNRHTHRAQNRVREGNFSLDGLVGFDMFGKNAGVIGTGRIGKCAINILSGFGCNILAYNRSQDPELAARPGVKYVSLDELYSASDIITLHVPLSPETRHMIDERAIARMKPGVMIINTGRGALIDTAALIEGLKSGKVGSAGLDVYEEESSYFFEDFSATVISDDTLARLLTFHNVMVTSHQAFLTREALENIARTTLDSIAEFEQGRRGSQLSCAV